MSEATSTPDPVLLRASIQSQVTVDGDLYRLGMGGFTPAAGTATVVVLADGTEQQRTSVSDGDVIEFGGWRWAVTDVVLRGERFAHLRLEPQDRA